MPYSVTTLSKIKALTVSEVKKHLNIDDDFSDDDTYLLLLVDVAVNYIENHTRRALLTQTITANYDGFNNCFEIERPPLQSVTSISYIDTSGATQVLSSSDYIVDTVSTPARIVPNYGESWPSTRCIVNAVTVVYVAGYTSTDLIPNQIKHALKLIVGDFYESRENTIVGVSITEPSFAVKSLLSHYVVSL